MLIWLPAGDNERVAGSVARQVGITSYQARLRPEDKLGFVKHFYAQQGQSEQGDGKGGRHGWRRDGRLWLCVRQ